MWTPRRILLLLLGIAGFTSCFLVYTTFLGGIDGLPELPVQYLAPTEPVEPPSLPNQTTSPTFVKLQQAFGPNCAEVSHENDNLYKLRWEDRVRGAVFASGQPVINGSAEVSVSPFSVAMFGKPKAKKLPNEVDEISTFHADQAILEFDQPITTAQQLFQAKLIGMKLLGVPEMPSTDRRRGRIWVTNNQRSADPSQHLVFHTTGPLYYESPDHPARKSPTAPHIWTHASVEVVDLRNLPRTLHAPPPQPIPERDEDHAVAQVRAEDLRNPNAIEDILFGATLPPPTMTSSGMNIYLEIDKPDPSKPKPPQSSSALSGYSGVKSIDLRENVQLNLWSDGGSGMIGTTEAAPNTGVAPMPLNPSMAETGMVGGLLDGSVMADRLQRKRLLVVDTLGSFHYDFEKSTAHFETSPIARDGVANFVTVARLSATGKQDDLSCKVLDIAFDGGKDREKSANMTSTAGSMTIKSLHATGPHVYVSFEADGLSAQGTELRYLVDAPTRTSTTILKGTPVIALRDRNKLLAGGPARPAEVVIKSTDAPPKDVSSKDVSPQDGATAQASAKKKQTEMSVQGPGRMDLYDDASGTTSLQATWGRSLTHVKEMVGDEEQDLLKFEGGGSFIDTKGEMTLSADRLWLWLSDGDQGTLTSKPTSASTKSSDPSKGALPQRLLAVGHVEGDSPDLIIEKTDHLTVWFRDIPPPPTLPVSPNQAAPPIATAQVVVPASGTEPRTNALTPPPAPVVTALGTEPRTAEPQKGAAPATLPKAEQPPPLAAAEPKPAKAEKPPMHLSARQIVSRMVRFPEKVAVAKPGQPPLPANTPPKPGQPTTTRLKYEMEQTLCDDRVIVTQEPTDPTKAEIGVYITGDKLRVDGAPGTSVMTVTSLTRNWAQVHYENLSLFGPEVVIDQLNNAANVKGRGMLRMPSSNGDETTGKEPEDLEIQWSKLMDFRGTNGTGATAQFIGQVQAVQMPHRVAVGPRIDLTPKEQLRHTALRDERGDRVFEEIPPPRLLSPAGPTSRPKTKPKPGEPEQLVERSVVLCHQMDVTFDKPIYFNDYKSRTDRPAATPASADGKKNAPEEKAKLKSALCTPMADEEIAVFPGIPIRHVVYQNDFTNADGKIVKAQRIEARQIDVRNEGKEQKVYASGPGEVRILQLGSKDDFGSPTATPPTTQVQAKTAAAPKQEMKLTVVRFLSRMVATDMGELFQKAEFDDGARVHRFPSTNLNQRFVDHDPPKGTLFLDCYEMLTVSSAKAKADAPPDQWMVAKGNAQFRTEEYEGIAETITYRDDAVLFDGGNSNARLYRVQRSVNSSDNYNAKNIIYHRSGLVETRGTASGTFTTP